MSHVVILEGSGLRVVKLTLLGQPASKANRRKVVTFGKRAALIKSEEARKFEFDSVRQIPPSARIMIAGLVRVTLRLYYATALPDLDESVVLDVLQAKYHTKKRSDGTKVRELWRPGVYVNDRQVFEKHVFKTIRDPNPRVELEVEELGADWRAPAPTWQPPAATEEPF